MKTKKTIPRERNLPAVLELLYCSVNDARIWPFFLLELSELLTSSTPGGPNRKARSARGSGNQNIRLAHLQDLIPHLSRAAEMRLRVISMQAEQKQMADLLNCMPIGVILVNAKGRVYSINQNAGKILSLNDGIRIKKGTILANSPEETTSLKKMMEWATNSKPSDSPSPGRSMLLRRPSDRRPYPVLIMPLNSDEFPAEEGGAAALFIGDPDVRMEGAQDRIQYLYGLTPAEARLACMLMQGKSLQEAARESRLTVNTVRNQLKGVFEKTATRSQSDLIRLLLLGPVAQAPQSR